MSEQVQNPAQIIVVVVDFWSVILVTVLDQAMSTQPQDSCSHRTCSHESEGFLVLLTSPPKPPQRAQPHQFIMWINVLILRLSDSFVTPSAEAKLPPRSPAAVALVDANRVPISQEGDSRLLEGAQGHTEPPGWKRPLR